MKLSNVKRILPCFLLTVVALTVSAFAESTVFSQYRDSEKCSQCGGIMLYSNVNLSDSYCGKWDARCPDCGFHYCAMYNPSHNWIEFSREDPTCSLDGNVVYRCPQCVVAKTEFLPALGGEHTWIETSRIDATTTAPGSIEYTCSRCSDIKTETIPQLPSPPTPSGSMTMPQLLSTMTSVFNEIFQWIAAVSAAIASNPILLLCVVIGFTSTGVVLFRRLLNL